MSVTKFKRGDTKALRVTLRDKRGPVDLDGATVLFYMRGVRSIGTPTVNGESAVVEQETVDGRLLNKGVVRYDWNAPEVATAGLYDAEFEVTFADGSIQTFPSRKSDYRIDIVPDIRAGS